MDNVEAIELLREKYRTVSMCITAEDCRKQNKAIDIAIKALKFDLENFQKELTEWHNSIQEDLKQDTYDLHLRCVNDVLETIECMIYDNTLFEEDDCE